MKMRRWVTRERTGPSLAALAIVVLLAAAVGAAMPPLKRSFDAATDAWERGE